MAQVQILYVATATGLRQLANPGKSDRWRLVGEALTGQEVVAVAASATDPLAAYAGSSAGVSQTTNGGATWETVLDRPVTALVAAPDGAIYAGTDEGAVWHASAETSWRDVWRASAPIKALSTFSDGELVMTAADGTVVRGQEGNWRPLPALQNALGPVVANPNEPGHLFTTTAHALLLPRGAQPLDPPPTGGLVMLSGKAPVLLVATAGPVFRSEDEGITLAAVEGPLGVQVLVTPLHFLDYAYAGTGSGELWLTRDRGRSWLQLQSGFAPILDLSFARVL